MLNYVAIQVVTFCIVFWENPAGSNTVRMMAGAEGWVPGAWPHLRRENVILVAVLTVGIYIYMKYSKHGYEISVGREVRYSRYAGVDV